MVLARSVARLRVRLSIAVIPRRSLRRARDPGALDSLRTLERKDLLSGSPAGTRLPAAHAIAIDVPVVGLPSVRLPPPSADLADRRRRGSLWSVQRCRSLRVTMPVRPRSGYS